MKADGGERAAKLPFKEGLKSSGEMVRPLNERNSKQANAIQCIVYPLWDKRHLSLHFSRGVWDKLTKR